MKRRDVLAMLGTGALIVATPVRAQIPNLPVVGYLSAGSAAAWTHRIAAFRKGLAEAGYSEGHNVAIEFRWAEGQYERLPELAAELVRRKVSVLVAGGGATVALAARHATSTVPVLFAIGGDPVELGLAASLNRPGGNMTGVTIRALELEAKLLSLVHELVPQAATAGILVNPRVRPISEGYVRAAQQAERTLGIKFHVLHARTDQEIDEAFAALSKLRVGAPVVGADPFFEIRRAQLVALAARNALPALYFERDFVIAGGLASYGTDLDEASRQVGLYAGKILAGAKPADLPIVQLTKIELVINLKTAKALGLTIPQSLLLRADEVIQ